MTLTLTAGDAIAVPTAGKALALAPVLYSDAERNLIGCVWFEAFAATRTAKIAKNAKRYGKEAA